MHSSLFLERTGAGAPVLLLHSSGLSGRQWKRLARALVARGHEAVVPDLVGHGGSAPWPEPKPFAFQADLEALSALLRETGPAHLVGHSYGGLLALQLALRAPGAVRTLALYEPVAWGALDAVRDADALAALALPEIKATVAAVDHERWLETFVDFWNGAGGWRALRPEAREEFRRSAWVVREGVRSLSEDHTPASAYASIAAPTLLLAGELSPVAAGRVVARLEEALPNARARTVKGAGHMGPLTHADEVNETILEALSDVHAPSR